jgi:C4-dicarboxylate-specific signal transduction histidine kinase
MTTPVASAGMIEAMGLALGRLDTSAAEPLAALSTPDLPSARREDLLRRLLAGTRLIAANRQIEAMLGVAQAALPLPLTAIWPFDQAELLARALAATAEPGGRFRAQMSLRALDGRIVHLDFTSWREADMAAGQVAIGLADLSEQVRAQENLLHVRAQIAHAERLSTLGVMTATIAHEVRQPLGAMMTSAAAALRWLRRDPPDLVQAEECLNTILAGAIKAGETVAGLRAMASNKTGARERLAIGTLIAETAAFLDQELASRQATLLLEIADNLPPILADQVQIRQVVINLMINAAQAMADARCWSRTLRLRARAEGDYVLVDVEDSGPGVPDADRERMFEGFFTTKPGGLGLGLRICRQIVEDHGGTLDHVSKGPAGSIFRFSLPVELEETGT